MLGRAAGRIHRSRQYVRIRTKAEAVYLVFRFGDLISYQMWETLHAIVGQLAGT